MAHCVRGFIATSDTWRQAGRLSPAYAVVGLAGGFALQLERDPQVATDAGITVPGEFVEIEDAADVLPTATEIEFERSSSNHGPVAYVASRYFGGHGVQCGIAWRNGGAASPLGVSTGAGPINRALAAIGCPSGDDIDEFDYVGLGRFRNQSDWHGAAASTSDHD